MRADGLRPSPWYDPNDTDYGAWLDHWTQEAADLWDWAVQLPAEELSPADAPEVLRMLREARLLDDVPPGSDAEAVLIREFGRRLVAAYHGGQRG